MNFFIGAYHDAVLLYGTALNETLEMGGNPRDGYNLSRLMMNRDFIGTLTIYVQILRSSSLKCENMQKSKHVITEHQSERIFVAILLIS